MAPHPLSSTKSIIIRVEAEVEDLPLVVAAKVDRLEALMLNIQEEAAGRLSAVKVDRSVAQLPLRQHRGNPSLEYQLALATDRLVKIAIRMSQWALQL